MGFSVETTNSSLTVRLTGWDRAMNWRQHVTFPLSRVAAVRVEARSALEPSVQHRERGCGTHNGAKRPNKRRVGTMVGRGIAGKQFWAVAASAPDCGLLVLDLADHAFVRAVLEVPNPKAVAAELPPGHRRS